MTTSSLDPDTILRTIAAWPIEEQVRLARTILQRATAHIPASTERHQDQAPQRSTWEALYGIASNGQEPPTDEQVAQWLDEHRMEKYGG